MDVEEKRIIPLKFDLMFKKIFGDIKDKMPLRKLLECILGINPKEITILNPEVIGSSYYNKGTIVDLIVEIEDGTKIGIEMNTNVNKSLINRNLFYMFKIMVQNRKKGSMYNNLEKHIQINFDCEGYHQKPIMKYRLMDGKTKDILTDKIEIIRIDVPYFVKRCYNKDVRKLDYKDRFIGLIGTEDIKLAKTIIDGDKSMEEIMKKMEDFSVNEEILGAYDAEFHRREVERVVMLEKIEEAVEQGIKEGLKQGIEQGIEQEKENIAKNMLNQNIDIELISKVTGLSEGKINKLKQ